MSAQAISAFNAKPKKGIDDIAKICLTREQYALHSQSTEAHKQGAAQFEQARLELDLSTTKEVEKLGQEALAKTLSQTQASKIIAKFLHDNSKELNKHALGDFFGEQKNQNILHAFTEQMNFKGKDFDLSLRKYMQSFRMPGEAQKVDRVLESFGMNYSTANPSITADAAYVTAVATIGLNTSLHNPAVKVKPSLKSFSEQLHDLTSYNKVVGFGPKEVEKLYESVKQNEIKLAIPETVPGYTITAPDKSKDKVFDQVNRLFGSSQSEKTDRETKFDVTKTMKAILPHSEITSATIDKPRSWLKRLMGYHGKITIKTANNEQVTMQCYQPSIFSGSKKPRIIVQPSHENMHPNENSIVIAAQMSARFDKSAIKVEATYDYTKEDMVHALSNARGQKHGLQPKPDRDGKINNAYTPLKLIPPRK